MALAKHLWLVYTVIACGVIAGISAGCSPPEPVSQRTTPETDTAPVELPAPVPKDRRHITRCKYCGSTISTETETVQGRLGVAVSDRYSYSTCASKTCQRMAALQTKHPSWSVDDCQTIIEKKIRIGMTKDQVLAAWGKPRDINRTVTAFGVSEQWCYGDFGPYLYFDDGIMTSFQD